MTNKAAIPSRHGWVLFTVGAGTFMAALDSSIVNTILPILRTEMGSSVATIQWIVVIYLLVLSGLLLPFGRLGDIKSHKSIYQLGFAIFITSSALCGLAWSPLTLILFRGLQAIGGAMLSSNSPAILTGIFPAQQRGRAFGLVSTMTYLGLMLGPSLGGWLAQVVSWRIAFLINIPVGLTALFLCTKFIPKDIPAQHHQRFDFAGSLLFIIGLTSLLLGLNRGADWGWGNPLVLGLLLGSILVLGIFLVVETRSSAPMLNLSLFKHKLFSASVASAVLNYICVYSIMFLIPFYLIQGRGYNSTEAGLFLTAQPVIMAITAPISGSISDRYGSRLPGMIGMAALVIGLILLANLGETTRSSMIILSLAIAGFGTGIFVSPNTSSLMGSAPSSHQGIASGVQAAARNVGMVLGIGLTGAILTTHLAQNTPDAFFHGIDAGFYAASAFAFFGILLSAIKEK
jgi:EmrB/QacA subfamily drug resistance transporter